MVVFYKTHLCRKLKILVFVILIISPLISNAQKIEITITGKIIDVADSSITNSYIKVSNTTTKLIL